MFNASRKLGFIFTDMTTKKARLSEKMKLGMLYESLVRSETWPIMKALLDSKAEQAVNKLRKLGLSENDRVTANCRASFIEEIYSDMELEIKKARLAKIELDKIKEN